MPKGKGKGTGLGAGLIDPKFCCCGVSSLLLAFYSCYGLSLMVIAVPLVNAGIYAILAEQAVRFPFFILYPCFHFLHLWPECALVRNKANGFRYWECVSVPLSLRRLMVCHSHLDLEEMEKTLLMRCSGRSVLS